MARLRNKFTDYVGPITDARAALKRLRTEELIPLHATDVDVLAIIEGVVVGVLRRGKALTS